MSIRASELVVACAVAAAGCGGSGGGGGSTPEIQQQGKPPDAAPVARSLFVAKDTSVAAAVEQAALIFDGTVIAPDTIKGPGAPARMRVRIGQVLRRPEAMDDITGDTATVAALDSLGLGVGQRAVFFTYGLAVGAKLVVKEVKRIAVSSDADVQAVRPKIAAADTTVDDRTIVANADSADAVVLVRVDSLMNISVGRGSEHTPEWKVAVAQVLRAFRASDSALVKKHVATLFADGGTELTENAPQLRAGESRILWLHRLSNLADELRGGIDTTGRYFILEADDARPAADSNRVARALRQTKFITPP